jgi:hypothetical protein
MTTKTRLSASIDARLIAEAEAAVAAGAAATLSAWMNDAVRLKLEHDKRLAAAEEFFAWWEAEHGKITDDDIRRAEQWARDRTVSVRKSKQRAGRRR